MGLNESSLYPAKFWRPADKQDADCFLCSHRCRIRNGNRGICGVRVNSGGMLYSLVYGRLIAENVDPIEKKPLYHFLPGTRSYSIATPGCNFRCDFCQNWQISQARDDLDQYTKARVDPGEIVSDALRAKCASIAYTYTEPTIFMEYALDVAGIAKSKGIKNVFVTNGYETPEAVDAMRGLIDAANVDLKSFSDEFYRKACKGRLEPVLDSIRGMHAAGIHVEVTTLVVPTRNDSDEELAELASFLAGVSRDIPWHISRFHPDYKAMDSFPTPINTLEKAARIGEDKGLRFIYIGNVFETDRQDTRCPQCGETVIQRSLMQVKSMRIDTGKCASCGAPLPIVVK